jgi:hypothetical protein
MTSAKRAGATGHPARVSQLQDLHLQPAVPPVFVFEVPCIPPHDATPGGKGRNNKEKCKAGGFNYDVLDEIFGSGKEHAASRRARKPAAAAAFVSVSAAGNSRWPTLVMPGGGLRCWTKTGEPQKLD